MEAVRIFHIAARWLLVLIEAGALLWLMALLLALLGWAGWSVAYLFKRGRGSVGRPKPVAPESVVSRLPPVPARQARRSRQQNPRRAARR
jgi:hypothetical protein